MRFITRACLTVAVLLGVVGAWLARTPARALASTNQLEMFQDDIRLLADPGPTLQQIRDLGGRVVRVSVHWNIVAPYKRPAGFNATDPASYPGWSIYDEIVQDALQDGIVIDFSVGGPAPPWATGAGQPAPGGNGGWKPSAADFKQFVQAVGTRYSGTYDPTLGKSVPHDANDLPRVSFWELWNEPNFGGDLAPQATHGSTVLTSPAMYRNLLDAGWSALHSTGHGQDTIVIGNLDARGAAAPPGKGAPQGLPGNFGATKPLQFVRALYCVSSTYKELRGGTAAAVGCPTSTAASRHFRAANPGLFQASGFATHPYPVNLPPNVASSTDPDYTEFSELPRFASLLDRLQRIYGSGKRFPIYNNEYGYITNPPNRRQAFVSPSTAARYLNWAEYLSFLNPRIASTMQYLLIDPPARTSGFDSGLEFPGGARKPTYAAYRLALYLPAATVHRGAATLVWGCARPAHAYGNERVQIQFRAHHRGPWRQVAVVHIRNPRGYFETRLSLSTSGDVRLAWSYPAGPTVYSRTATLTIS